MVQRVLFVCMCILVSWSAVMGQQVLRTPQGVEVGTKLVVNSHAPYCILLSDGVRPTTELIALGRKVNNLGANVLLVTMVGMYCNNLAPADSLVDEIGWRIAELRKVTTAPIFLLAEHRLSAAALIAATKYFAIKGVIVASTGEYFFEEHYVEHSLRMLRAPILSLCTPQEVETVRGVFRSVPRKFVVFASDLETSGFSDLLKNTKQAGKIWLALSLFYHEHFDAPVLN